MSLVSTGCASRAWSWVAAPSVAPGVGWAACLSVSVVDCEVCANAGVAATTIAADSSHADLRIMFSLPCWARPGGKANPDQLRKEASAGSAQRKWRRAEAQLQQ